MSNKKKKHPTPSGSKVLSDKTPKAAPAEKTGTASGDTPKAAPKAVHKEIKDPAAEKAADAPRPRTIAGQIVEYNPTPEERAAAEEDKVLEDNLELATMSSKERRAVKKARREKEMEGMNKKERFKYLLYYYQWHIILTVIIVGCTTWLLIAVLKSKPPVALSAAILNKSADKEVTESIFDTYMTEGNINSTYRTVVECFHLDLETLMNDFHNNPNDGQFVRFPTLARESYFDIAITNRGGLDYLANTDLAIYPDYILPLDLYEQLKSYEVEAKDGYDQTFVYGYDISSTDFAKSLDLGYDDIYLCFVGNTSESMYHSEHFIRYIFHLPAEEN